jgi:hypothetical protein
VDERTHTHFLLSLLHYSKLSFVQTQADFVITSLAFRNSRPSDGQFSQHKNFINAFNIGSSNPRINPVIDMPGADS